jgi:EmrB/QacA subfamily drug resistance transporter
MILERLSSNFIIRFLKNQLRYPNMKKPMSKRSALLTTASAAFLTPFMGSAVNIALPSIGREFTMDAIVLNWVSTSYILAAAMFLVPFGRIADIYGRKKIFTYGIMLFNLSSFLSAFSLAPWMLISARIVQGIGSAMIFGTGIAIVTSIFSVGERGKALGINVTFVYLGLSMGPFIGGFLTEHWGWRSIFLFILPLGLLVWGAVFWRLEGEWAEAHGEKFDWVGSFLYCLTLVAILYGFSRLPSQLGVGLIGIGVFGLGIFTKWEIKTKSPVLDIRLFRNNRIFAFSSLATLIHYGATYAVSFFLSLYLQYIKGFSPSHAGSIMLCQPVTQALFAAFAGRLSDKIEPRLVASIGMGCSSFGLFLLIFLKEKTPMEFIIMSLILLGLGFAFFSSPNINAVMNSVEKKFYGVSSGTISTMRLVGQALSMGLTILIFSLYIGRVQMTAESYPLFLKSAHIAFVIFSLLCFGGIFASLARGKVR